MTIRLLAVVLGVAATLSAPAQLRRRRAATPSAPPAKQMRDVVAPAVPDPEPQAGSCSTTLQTCSAAKYCFPGTNSACVQAGFADGQAWRVCINATEYGTAFSANGGPSKGLAVGPADFRRSGSASWQRAIYSAGTAEIFTGYDNLPPSGRTRIYDTFAATWLKAGGSTAYSWSRKALTPPHVPAGGKLLTLARDGAFGPRAAAECRDRGIAWLCHGNQATDVRRGEELVLWGVFDAANYDYVVEYGFHDDGTISFRTGATGYNNPNLALASPGDVPHVHDVLWRVDVDVAGGLRDTAMEAHHIEGTPIAKDQETPFHGGIEGGIDWDPERYTSVIIENAGGQGYEIHPLRFGNARHPLSGEKDWTAHDFWITQWHPEENSGWADTYQTPDAYLTVYSRDESIVNTDVVLWYLASAHHDPIDEDRQPGGAYGVTLAHYFGFELNPHNLFPQNPLGGPKICD